MSLGADLDPARALRLSHRKNSRKASPFSASGWRGLKFASLAMLASPTPTQKTETCPDSSAWRHSSAAACQSESVGSPSVRMNSQGRL
ncbi:MAG: hypothetical protein WDN24_14410 [Sphingomonas sp.]